MSENAKVFRQLHNGPEVLLLTNCWDAASARILESLGARAIATTSAGLSWSNGYSDGNALPMASLVAGVHAITRVTKLPVSVDLEDGYSDDPTKVADSIAMLIDAGAVGINLEDGASRPASLAAKIEHVKRRAARLGVDLFVNARTDVYARALVPPASRIEEVLARAKRYRSAGADGFFVPKVVEPAEIETIASSVELPLNVLASPRVPPASELQALGVRRLSSGSAFARLAFGRLAATAAAFLRKGESEPLSEGAFAFGEIDGLFQSR